MFKIQLLMKRIIDFVVSLLLVIGLSPFFLLVALIIKFTSEGPIIFKQQRPGLNQKIFEIYKFRTMKPGSETMIAGQEVMSDDNRVTSIGKYLRRFKIDELPQIYNILKGEMSLVGPRPERIASLAEYTDEIAKRLNMLPGMTGLAQVSGNIHLTLQDRYKFDVYYIENYSLCLDIKIIIRTVGVVLLGENRYVNQYLVDVKKKITEVNSTKEETISK